MAVLYRGAIVSGFGQIETGIAELSLRILNDANYRAMRATPPYGATKTAAFLKDVLDASGPLQRFRRVGHLFLDRFQNFAELRTLMAHGAMSVVPNWGVTVEYVNRARGGLIEQRSQRFSLLQLQTLAEQVNRLSRLGQRLYWRADLETVLPPRSWHATP